MDRNDLVSIRDSLAAKKDPTAQDKRDFMLLDMYLRDQPVVTAQAIPEPIVEIGDINDAESLKVHLDKYIDYKRKERVGISGASAQAMQELRLFALEVTDLINDINQYTSSRAERDILKSIELTHTHL